MVPPPKANALSRPGKNYSKVGSILVKAYDDEVPDAYCLAQPDLTTEAVRSIADFIQFLHDQELRRAE